MFQIDVSSHRKLFPVHPERESNTMDGTEGFREVADGVKGSKTLQEFAVCAMMSEDQMDGVWDVSLGSHMMGRLYCKRIWGGGV